MLDDNSPVTYDISYPQSLSRAMVLVKVLFGTLYVGIPHGIILSVYGGLTMVTSFFAFLAILFTGRYPDGLFNFNLGFVRWNARVNAYMTLMTDQYPPFTGQPVEGSPVDVQIEQQQTYSRGMALIKLLLGPIYVLIPHMVILGFLGIWASITTAIAFFVILFTGRYPEGTFKLNLEIQRWITRVGAYMSFMTEQYPPFNGRP